MELFAVNRYTSEETITPKHDILSDLLKKVEKRKRDSKFLTKKAKLDEVSEKEKAHEQDDEVKEVATTLEEHPELIERITNDQEYEILGEDVQRTSKQDKAAQKAKVVLPSWLSHPVIISTCLVAPTTEDTEDELTNSYPYLAPHIFQTLKELKVTSLFPVQSCVIPWILEAHDKPPPFRPRDICVSAPTGSGKTLAFAIPVVQILAANRVMRKIRALVVLPVAGLATQVYKVFKKLCEKTDLTVQLFSQQSSFAVEQGNLIDFYKGNYYSKADIIVTTPGRLVDHLHSTKGFCLRSLKFLIIDEADRIMDAVFQNWCYHLDAHVRSTTDQLLTGRAAPLCYNELIQQNALAQPHKLLFSATLSQDPEKLQHMHLFQPKLFTSVLTDIEVLRAHFTKNAEEDQSKAIVDRSNNEFIGKYTTPAELVEKVCITESNLKPLTLSSLISEQGWKKFLCFTNSGDAANRLTFVLKRLCGDDSIAELSGNMSQNERQRALTKFMNGEKRGLVCSDALARGIDVDVDVVISYDMPRHIKTYIHRIGRTARAGRHGTAVTLLTQAEQKHFNQILSEVGKHVTEEINVSSTMEETNAKLYADVLAELRKKIEMDKNKKTWAKRNAKSMAVQQAQDPATMTLMQQLQLAVDKVMVDDAQSKGPSNERKVGRRHRKRKPKKKNK